jgi:hypothetical protein
MVHGLGLVAATSNCNYLAHEIKKPLYSGAWAKHGKETA